MIIYLCLIVIFLIIGLRILIFLNDEKKEKKDKKEIKNIYNEVLINLYSQYSKAIDELNLEKASFLLYNIRIVKFGNDKRKENKDVQDLS